MSRNQIVERLLIGSLVGVAMGGGGYLLHQEIVHERKRQLNVAQRMNLMRMQMDLVRHRTAESKALADQIDATYWLMEDEIDPLPRDDWLKVVSKYETAMTQVNKPEPVGSK
jgi:hypothetical protein